MNVPLFEIMCMSFIPKMSPEVVLMCSQIIFNMLDILERSVCFKSLEPLLSFRAQSKKQKACLVKRGLCRRLLARATTARLC